MVIINPYPGAKNLNILSENRINLPRPVDLEISGFFSPGPVLSALELIKSGKVRLDYTKESRTKTFIIVSGRINDSREFSTSLKLKQDNLESNCDCHNWTMEKHCEHVASLLIKYRLQEIQEKGVQIPDFDSNMLNTDLGATPWEYGTMLNKANELKGVASNLDFPSAQYCLTNKKVVHFPQGKPLEGKLVINLIPSYTLYYDKDISIDGLDLDPSLMAPRFLWKNSEDQEFKEISLFNHTHLFNWESGDLFNFSSPIVEFLRRIRYRDSDYRTEDFLLMAKDLWLDQTVEFQVEGEMILQQDAKTPAPQAIINTSDRKGHLNFVLNFKNEDESLSPLPTILQTFAFNNGYLSSFKKKSNAYNFLQSLNSSLKNERKEYAQELRTSRERQYLEKVVSSFLSTEDEFSFEYQTRTLYRYDKKFLVGFFQEILERFGEGFFRFSTFIGEENSLKFEVPAGNLFEGISDFHTKLHVFGLQIFYDKKQISRWRSRIRFERKTSTMNWFELDLKLTKEDMELIKNVDLENGFAVTTKGLVLLSPEQKDLVRLMKRYTQVEKKEEKVEEDGLVSYSLPLNRARIFELFELRKLGIDGALTEEEIDLCERLANLEEMPQYDVPTLNGEIARPYQVDGYQWLRFLFENKLGACLADDMGLGKTLQTILFIQSIIDQVDKILIVCPVSIIMNWQKEFEKFSNLDTFIYYDGNRVYSKDHKIIITSYGVMKKEYNETFQGEHFDIMILDEVQHLKNIRSLGANAARKISADFRVTLTGTPVENDLSEFYNILDLSIPGIWGDLQFIKTSSSKKNRFVARKTARPFILRRTKAQVLSDLPEKIEHHVFLHFDEDEDKEYKLRLTQIRTKINQVIPRKRYGEILKGLLELRQLCLWQSTKQFRSTKIDFLLENLEQILEEGHQAIIFSQFTTYLNFIQKELEKRTWKFSRIDGSLAMKRRQKEVDLFQEGKNPLFLISLKAGGTGLNLTAASYVFLMDPWWNPAVESQAIDRAHRIGQQNKLTVYRPIMKNTVEEKVLKLQEIKKELFQDLMADQDDSFFTGKLTMDDFEALFR